jgi:hypothetical protein
MAIGPRGVGCYRASTKLREILDTCGAGGQGGGEEGRVLWPDTSGDLKNQESRIDTSRRGFCAGASLQTTQGVHRAC